MQQPLIKWAGGKRWLARKLYPEINKINFDRYLEPFFGGGALFFALTIKESIIADNNSELMNFYTCVASEHIKLFKALSKISPSKEKYYYYRNLYQPTTPIAKAIRFYFLISNSWNGLYRVNRNGEFNVPYSYKNRKSILSLDEFEEKSEKLKGSKILTQDFEETINMSSHSDLIFADPPYFSKKNNTFTKYNPAVFNDKDQSRLARALICAEKRGASWILTNGSLEQISNHFIGYDIFRVPRFSIIAAKKTARKPINEYVVLANNAELISVRMLLSSQYKKVRCE